MCFSLASVGCPHSCVQREDDSLASPTKYVVKRKIIDLSLDDSSEEEKQPSPKKLSVGKSSAGGKSGAAAAWLYAVLVAVS
jgi:hypothetical protein